MRFPAVATLAVLALSGCVTGGAPSLTNTPASAAVPTGGGIIGGGLVVSAGADLSRRERLAAIDAEYRALESTPAGQPVAWRDDRTGRGGTVTAAQPYRVGSQDCRPYTHVVNAGGPALSVRGTACRNPDGSWTLLN